MGRTKYSPEKRNEIIISFVKATIEILKEDGIDEVYIRHVSTRAGYSSATLYLYFKDLNELVSLSSIFYLRNYVNEIAQTGNEKRTPKETYRYTWDVFVRHALNKPDIYLNLFFGPNSDSLDENTMAYYGLFPDELDINIDDSLLDMLASGRLLERNKKVLRPYAAELGMTEEKINLANEVTVAYFRSILERACKIDVVTQEIKDNLTEEFLKGAFFILGQ